MLQGLPVSPGIAVGRAVIIRFRGLAALRRAVPPDELEREERRLRRAAAKATEDFARHSRETKGDIGSELAAILEAHGLIASDETYLGAICERIRRDRVNAEWALAEVTRELGGRLAAADSAAMREREADIADVAREVAAHLSGGNVQRGQAIFNSPRTACITCHAMGYLGGTLGPDLTRIGQIRTERDLLEAIVYPSSTFVRSYEPMRVKTAATEMLGIIRGENADEITLAVGPGAEMRVPRAEVAAIEPATMSLMPQGFDGILSPDELADLVTFLKSLH